MKRFAIGLPALLLAQAAPAAQVGAVPAADPVAAVFAAWDRDGDGRLSLAEFRAGRGQAQAIARAREALARQFAAIDADHDRAIDAHEYANLVLVERAGKAAPPLARFDADGDGRLEFAEYARLVATLAPREDAKK
jgi:Ca2+-binding EF-hand superfamily protein